MLHLILFLFSNYLCCRIFQAFYLCLFVLFLWRFIYTHLFRWKTEKYTLIYATMPHYSCDLRARSCSTTLLHFMTTCEHISVHFYSDSYVVAFMQGFSFALHIKYEVFRNVHKMHIADGRLDEKNVVQNS